MGVSIEYLLHMTDGEVVNMSGNTVRFYDCFKIENFIDNDVPHTISKYYLNKFSDEGISLPREFYSMFKVVD